MKQDNTIHCVDWSHFWQVSCKAHDVTLCDIFSSCINLILHRLWGCPDCMHYEIINCIVYWDEHSFYDSSSSISSSRTLYKPGAGQEICKPAYRAGKGPDPLIPVLLRELPNARYRECRGCGRWSGGRGRETKEYCAACVVTGRPPPLPLRSRNLHHRLCGSGLRSRNRYCVACVWLVTIRCE